ncbi:MAG: DUF5123 domain-containing protein [Bacteroidetes bacterium]|nr:MAG: DUF5123 domain-containing protein [Bacteroidota bacterium]
MQELLLCDIFYHYIIQLYQAAWAHYNNSMGIKKTNIKANNIIMKKLSLAACLLVLIFGACKKTETFEEVRLFRPVNKDALLSEGNWIKASWHPIKEAQSYTVQLSSDNFTTIIQSVTLDTTVYMFENLYWDKLYQVQVRANAADTVFNSGMSNLGSIKTAKFPTILNTPGISDVTDEAVKVSWTTGGAAVTSIKILKASDSSVVTTVTLTPTDVTNQYKIISGLQSATAYIIFLYSGTSVRGWADFTTAVPLSGNLVDLRGITGRPSVLTDTLPVIPSGSTVLLKRGETYIVATALSLSKSVTMLSGADLLAPGQAIISLPSNFNIVAGSIIDSIVFKDVTLRGTDYATKYVFNIDKACTIGKLNFISCKGEIFRGLVRTQSQPAIINNFLVDNCILDSLAGYGVHTVDVITARTDNIIIRNSTIYKAEKIITSRNNSISVLIENCTINEAPLGNSNYYVDYSTSPTNNVTNGITINNCIFGIGKYNAGNRSIRGIRVNAATTINASNNYRTFDQVSLGNDIPSITTYGKTSLELWMDPFNGNFKIIDGTYPARNTTGDPRWRP